MDTKLESYKTFVDIFKGYLDTALTANIGFYAFTGAIVAYYLTYREQKPYLKFSLIVPFIFGIALTIISLRGIVQASYLEANVMTVAGGLKIRGAPPIEILKGFLWITGILSGFVCICLLCLFFWRPHFILGR